MRPLAIYIHIPFCLRKCAYCDFASFAGREAQWADYFGALAGEIDAYASALKTHEITSVFFGGGTPSLVPAEEIAAVLDHLRACTTLAADAEVTLEANPGTLTPEKLSIYRAAGVNRLSIGVQSFDAEFLKMLGRIHTPEQACEAVEMARAAGFTNLSIDLMYALPGQDTAVWRQSVRAALALPLMHISAYSLIVEPGTPLAARVESGQLTLPDDDTVNEMQQLATAEFADAGFVRYEISNYAREGYESRHNFTYWDGGEYLGFGSAAHSLLGNERFANAPQPDAYIAGARALNRTKRTASDRMEEMLMLSTRTLRGLRLARWQNEFGWPLEEKLAKPLKKLMNYGLAEIIDGYLRLTEAGLELQDTAVLELMEALPEGEDRNG